jgi:threonine dehydratase
VDRVILVEDEAIRQSQRLLWKEIRIASEPGGAAAFAAILSGQYTPARDERVAVLLCGGNTDAVSFEG